MAGSAQVRPKHGPIVAGSAYRPVTLEPVTYDDLLATARRLEGKTLTTVTGKAFTVGIYLDTPYFTPASSGRGQSDGRKAAERFLERYNASGSLRPGDYADITRNASYFIGMLTSGTG